MNTKRQLVRVLVRVGRYSTLCIAATTLALVANFAVAVSASAGEAPVALRVPLGRETSRTVTSLPVWTSLGPTLQVGLNILSSSGSSLPHASSAAIGGQISDIQLIDEPNGLPSQIFVSYWSGGLWESSDLGHTWTDLTANVTPYIGAFAVAPSDPSVIYAIDNSWSLWSMPLAPNPTTSPGLLSGCGCIIYSTDGGITWAQVPIDLSSVLGSELRHIIVSPNDPNIVLFDTATTQPATSPPSVPNPSLGGQLYVLQNTSSGWSIQDITPSDAIISGFIVSDPASPTTFYATPGRAEGMVSVPPEGAQPAAMTTAAQYAGIYKVSEAGDGSAFASVTVMDWSADGRRPLWHRKVLCSNCKLGLKMFFMNCQGPEYLSGGSCTQIGGVVGEAAAIIEGRT